MASMMSLKVETGSATTQESSRSGRNVRTSRENLTHCRLVGSVSIPDEQPHLASVVDEPTHDLLDAARGTRHRSPRPITVVVGPLVRHDAHSDCRPVARPVAMVDGEWQRKCEIGEDRVSGIETSSVHGFLGTRVTIGPVEGQAGRSIREPPCRSVVKETRPDAHESHFGSEELARHAEQEQAVRGVPRAQRKAGLQDAGAGNDDDVVPAHPRRNAEHIE